jgi:hypothetical protein
MMILSNVRIYIDMIVYETYVHITSWLRYEPAIQNIPYSMPVVTVTIRTKLRMYAICRCNDKQTSEDGVK